MVLFRTLSNIYGGIFCRDCFRLYPVNFFVKSSNLDVWLVPLDASKKHFLCVVSEDFASWKIHVISTLVCLSLLFPREDVIDWKGVEWAEYKVVWNGLDGIYKNLHLIIWERGVNKWKYGKWLHFFLRIGIGSPPAIR